MRGLRRAESAIGFRLMELVYRFRDLLQDPRHILDVAKLGEGMRVADYGCGPGSFTIPAALIVGDGGTRRALWTTRPAGNPACEAQVGVSGDEA